MHQVMKQFSCVFFTHTRIQVPRHPRDRSDRNRGYGFGSGSLKDIVKGFVWYRLELDFHFRGVGLIHFTFQIYYFNLFL